MAYFLPEKFKFNHVYSFFLHDYLANLIVKGETGEKFNINIKFDKSEKEIINEFSDLQGEELFEWLNENGFKDEVDMLTYKHVFAAVLSDFCHFIHTALICSEKGKLSVTYSLLRKPFKDYFYIYLSGCSRCLKIL